MEKRGIVYNLYHCAERFMKDAKREGFYLKKLFYNNKNVGNYEIIKKITSTQNQLSNFEIIGHIFKEQFLIIHSFPFPIERKDIRRKQAVEQLEKLAKDFVIRNP